MNKIVLLVFCIGVSVVSFGQNKKFQRIERTDGIEFRKHPQRMNNDSLLQKSSVGKSKSGIKFSSKSKTILLKDNDSENNLEQYNVIADVKGTSLTLVQKLGANGEKYLFVDRQTAKVDTLIGEPMFMNDGKNIVCLGSVGADGQRLLQAGKILNGEFVNYGIYTLKSDMQPNDISWFDEKTLLIEDGKKNYWKLSLQ